VRFVVPGSNREERDADRGNGKAAKNFLIKIFAIFFQQP
jgi:hypothetical protein